MLLHLEESYRKSLILFKLSGKLIRPLEFTIPHPTAYTDELKSGYEFELECGDVDLLHIKSELL